MRKKLFFFILIICFFITNCNDTDTSKSLNSGSNFETIESNPQSGLDDQDDLTLLNDPLAIDNSTPEKAIEIIPNGEKQSGEIIDSNTDNWFIFYGQADKRYTLYIKSDKSKGAFLYYKDDLENSLPYGSSYSSNGTIDIISGQNGYYYIKIEAGSYYLGQYELQLIERELPQKDGAEIDDIAMQAVPVDITSLNQNPVLHNRNFHSRDDCDWIVINGKKDKLYQIDFRNINNNRVRALLFHESDFDNLYPYHTINEYAGLEFYCKKEGHYYIKLSGYNNALIDYQFALHEAVLNCTKDQYEEKNDDIPQNASCIRRNGIVQNHTIHYRTDTDWLHFPGQAGKCYWIKVDIISDNSENDVNTIMMFLYADLDKKEYKVESGYNDVLKSSTSPREIYFYCAKATEYWIKISDYSNYPTSPNSYKYEITVTEENPKDEDTYDRLDGSVQTAPSIPIDGTIQKRILHKSDDIDWIHFTGKKGYFYDIILTESNRERHNYRIVFSVYGANSLDVPLPVSTLTSGWHADNDGYVQCPADGDCYIKVQSGGGWLNDPCTGIGEYEIYIDNETQGRLPDQYEKYDDFQSIMDLKKQFQNNEDIDYNNYNVMSPGDAAQEHTFHISYDNDYIILDLSGIAAGSWITASTSFSTMPTNTSVIVEGTNTYTRLSTYDNRGGRYSTCRFLYNGTGLYYLILNHSDSRSGDCYLNIK